MSLDVASAKLVGSVRKPQEGGGEVTMYKIQVSSQDGQQWEVLRRFSEFAGLRAGLVSRHPAVQSIPFPAKGPFAKIPERESALGQWLAAILSPSGHSSRGARNDPQLNAFLVQTEVAPARYKAPLDRSQSTPNQPVAGLEDSGYVDVGPMTPILEGSRAEFGSAELSTSQRPETAMAASANPAVREIEKKGAAEKARADKAEQRCSEVTATARRLRAAMMAVRTVMERNADAQNEELRRLREHAETVSGTASAKAAQASQWSAGFRVQTVVAVLVSLVLWLRGRMTSVVAPLVCVAVPALAGLLAGRRAAKSATAIEDIPRSLEEEDEIGQAVEKMKEADSAFAAAAGISAADADLPALIIGDTVQVWHEVEVKEGSWETTSAPAKVMKLLSGGRVVVSWEDGSDPFEIHSRFVGAEGERKAKDAAAASSMKVGEQVDVWYESEGEENSWKITSSKGTIAKDLPGGCVEIDWGDGSALFKVPRKFLGPGGEWEAREAVKERMGPAAAAAEVDGAAARGPGPAPGAAPAAAAGPTTGPIPKSCVTGLELFSSTGWKTEKTETRGGVQVCLWESKVVPWSPTKAARFSCECRCNIKCFVDLIVSQAPKGAKQFDPLLDVYETLREGTKAEGNILYTNFLSPVPYVIGRRDFVTHSQTAFLQADELKKYGVQMPPGEYPADIGGRNDYDRSGAALQKLVYMIANVNAEHPGKPPNGTFVRGTVHSQSYLAIPLGKDRIKIIETQSLNPQGGIPSWAVDKGTIRIMERFISMRTWLEKQYKSLEKQYA